MKAYLYFLKTLSSVHQLIHYTHHTVDFQHQCITECTMVCATRNSVESDFSSLPRRNDEIGAGSKLSLEHRNLKISRKTRFDIGVNRRYLQLLTQLGRCMTPRDHMSRWSIPIPEKHPQTWPTLTSVRITRGSVSLRGTC